jgi:glycerate kinase
LESVDLVLTGEGAIDAQTLNGKTVLGIARAARNAKNGHGVPVVAFGGMVKLSGAQLHHAGISAAFAICDAPMPLAQSIARAEELLANATEHALRLWLSAKSAI